MATRSASTEAKNAAGLDFLAASRPARTILLRSEAEAFAGKFGGTISSRTTGRPALAKCAAIREPMVPAPSTTAFSMRCLMATFSEIWKVQTEDRLQKRHSGVKPGSREPCGK